MFKRVSIVALVAVLTAFGSVSKVNAQDGKALFQANCAACHNPLKDATGPALKGIDERVPSKEWLHKWVNNSAALIASGDKAANEVFNKCSLLVFMKNYFTHYCEIFLFFKIYHSIKFI